MLNDILKLLPLQGVTNKRALTQGVALLALGYVLLGFQPVHYGFYAPRAGLTCT